MLHALLSAAEKEISDNDAVKKILTISDKPFSTVLETKKIYYTCRFKSHSKK